MIVYIVYTQEEEQHLFRRLDGDGFLYTSSCSTAEKVASNIAGTLLQTFEEDFKDM